MGVMKGEGVTLMAILPRGIKSQAMHLWRREGRWAKTAEYRTKVRDELLKESGLKRATQEMKDKAWLAALKRFSPDLLSGKAEEVEEIEKEEDAADAEVSRDLEAAFEKASEEDADVTPDLVGDVFWVYSNMERPGLKAVNAPSTGAWALLKWARENPNRFFEQLLVKAAAKTGGESEERLVREGRRSLEDLVEFIRAERGQDDNEGVGEAQRPAASPVGGS